MKILRCQDCMKSQPCECGNERYQMYEIDKRGKCQLCGHCGKFHKYCPNCGYDTRLINSIECYNCEGRGETPTKTGSGPHEYEFEKCIVCNGVGELVD